MTKPSQELLRRAMLEETKPHWTEEKQKRHVMLCDVSAALCRIGSELEKAHKALAKLMQENADGN